MWLREGVELTGTDEGGEFSRDNMRNAGTDLGGMVSCWRRQRFLLIAFTLLDV